MRTSASRLQILCASMIGSGISSSVSLARVAEHHPLVAGADPVERVVVAGVVLHLVRRVDALRDVGRLLVDRDDHAARVGVEAVLGARVADLARSAARTSARDVDVGLGRDLAGDDDEAGRDERLAGDAAVGSSARTASRTESEIWSAILSGWPSVTDSEVKRNEPLAIGASGYRTRDEPPDVTTRTPTVDAEP